MVKKYHKRWFSVVYLADEYVLVCQFNYNFEKFNIDLLPVYFVLPVVKRFEMRSPHKNMKSHHGAGSGKKAGRCQFYTNFFPEELTNVSGARELREIWNLLKPVPLESKARSKYIKNAA